MVVVVVTDKATGKSHVLRHLTGLCLISSTRKLFTRARTVDPRKAVYGKTHVGQLPSYPLRNSSLVKEEHICNHRVSKAVHGSEAK